MTRAHFRGGQRATAVQCVFPWSVVRARGLETGASDEIGRETRERACEALARKFTLSAARNSRVRAFGDTSLSVNFNRKKAILPRTWNTVRCSATQLLNLSAFSVH